MEIKRQKYVNEISNNLAWLKSEIELRNTIQLTDVNIFAEDLMCGLLNLMYGYELINLNTLKQNYPVIDLGDSKNRIAVQVTFTKKRERVQKTINDFINYQYIEKYDRLIILILGTRTNFRKDFDTKNILTFSKDKDIIDINQIFRDIDNCDDEKLESIHDYLENQFARKEKNNEQALTSVGFVTNPPTNQCRFYQGRTNDENNVLSWLSESREPYVIRGTGGIGKTELAKAIWQKVEKEGDKYDVSDLAWIPYQNSDLKLSICRSFLITKHVTNTDVAWAKATEFFLKKRHRLLMFIDNIETAEDNDSILRSLKQYPFRTIITTRERLNIGVNDVELKTLSKDKCQELFYKFYTLERNDMILSEILEKAGYLTVAIELLAKTALIEEMDLQRLNEALIELEFNISEEAVVSDHDLLTKEDKIAEQLKTLFSISSCNTEQIHLLINISMFPSKEFSFDDAQAWFGVKRRTPLNSLIDRGWLRMQENSQKKMRYWMHPVLAGSIRLQTETILHKSCTGLIENFTRILSSENKKNIFERFSVISYAGSLEMYQRKFFCERNDVDFLIAMGNVYIEMAEYDRAIEVYKCALNIVVDIIGDDEKHIEISRLLGSAYKQCGKFDKAMFFYNDIMKKINNRFSDKAVNVICAYRDMGHMYKSVGDYVKALDFYNKAENKYIEEKKQHPELSSKYLAMIYYGKGNLFRCAENYTKSLNFYQKSKKIYKNLVTETNFEWMLIHDNIGVCYLGMDDYEKALRFHEKALELQDMTYKNISQPFMGLSYMYRGDVYMRYGNTADAYDDYKRAADIIRNSVGDKHPYMIRIKNHIAKYFMLIGKYLDAEKIELEALPFELTELGKLHPDTAELYNNLTDLYCAMDNEKKAKVYHMKIKKYVKTVLHSHPEVLKVWMREAKYYLKNNDFESAKVRLNQLIQEASDITKESLIVKHAKEMLHAL